MSFEQQVDDHNNKRSVAVIGAGVSGLTAAWLLQHKYRVDLYDTNTYAGGHTRTITVPSGPDEGTPVDTGFIVMNDRNYPLFSKLLAMLNVETRDSDMSFSFHDEINGYAYSGSSMNTLFSQRSNLLNIRHWSMINDIIRFNRFALSDIDDNSFQNETLKDYISRKKLGASFANQYLFPMGSAIWSSPCSEIHNFPAKAFLHFFKNHGLLSINDRPQWKHVAGGSQTYVKALLNSFNGKVTLEQPARRVTRTAKSVEVETTDGNVQAYDKVIIGTHADQALKLLGNPTEQEKKALGTWNYQENSAVLHTDETVMPPYQKAWASWNFTREAGMDMNQPASISYYMNMLQQLNAQKPYIVTLNRQKEIPRESIIDETVFTHPMYSFDSMNSQRELPALNENGPVLFCGSYFGYGFHEDAVRSAVHVAGNMGVSFDDQRANETSNYSEESSREPTVSGAPS